jgi:hypothetical protein
MIHFLAGLSRFGKKWASMLIGRSRRKLEASPVVEWQTILETGRALSPENVTNDEKCVKSEGAPVHGEND